MTKLNGIAAPDVSIADLQHFYGRPDFLDACADVVELDMGCGKGSFTTMLATRYPARTVLAADVLSDRLRKLVRRNRREGVDNMIVLKCEARMLIARILPDACLDRLHILCPDPWPKDKHRGNTGSDPDKSLFPFLEIRSLDELVRDFLDLFIGKVRMNTLQICNLTDTIVDQVFIPLGFRFGFFGLDGPFQFGDHAFVFAIRNQFFSPP